MSPNRLRRRLHAARTAGRGGLLPYVTGGYPDVATTQAILRSVDPANCLCVEVGIPFSDPIADGPVIQTSFSRALSSRFRLDDLLDGIGSVRKDIAVPLAAMVSYSIVHRRGPERFVRDAAGAGFDALIVPDISLEEADGLADLGREHDCPLVLLAAPTSSDARRERIAAVSEPFIYYQALAGVTGERDHLPPDLAREVQRLRSASHKPVCVGFGISTPEHVAAVCAVADGAIVGSAIVRRMNDAVDRGDSPPAIAAATCALIGELCVGLGA